MLERVTVEIDEDLKQYRAVLLSGCAVLGAAHLGFLIALEHENKLKFLKVISGASIGSIVAVFFLANISLSAVGHIFRETTLLSLLEPMQSIENILDQIGLAKSDKILQLCESVLQSNGYDAKTLTFGKLRQLGRAADLIIVASRYNGRDTYLEPAYFTTQTSPDMLVMDAIRLSINIPFLFAAPTYENSTYTDGVLTDELPFHYIATHYPEIEMDDMIAHAPYATHPSSSTTATISSTDSKSSMPKWLQHTMLLLKYTLRRIRHQNIYPDRILRTPVEQQNQLMELNASPEMIDYYIIKGLLNTRAYVGAKIPLVQ